MHAMRKNNIFICQLICLLLVAFAPAVVSAKHPHNVSKPGSGKLLSDWIGLQLHLIRNTKGISQGQIFKYAGLSSIALYESVVHAEKKYRSLAGQLQEFDGLPAAPTDKNTCWHASANAALATILRTFYTSDPLHLKKIDSLETRYQTQFSKEGCSGSDLQTGADYGKAVALAVVAWSKTDGSAKVHPAYQVPKGDGLWEPTPPAFGAPLAPYAYHNRTCVKGSTENTLPPVPAAFSTDPSSPFYIMVKEVYDVSTNLTEEQKAIALFWDDLPDGRSYGAGGHWASIFKQVNDQQKLSLIEAAEAFAKMNIALLDAFNACWKGKYTYNVLRPVTYIQKHMNHADWKPLIITPSHPEYPAAHASLSMAAATALTKTLGNNISFTDHSYDHLGYKARSYKNFEEAGKEAGISRLYGGIHYRPSIHAGYTLGSTTANNVLKGLEFKKK